MLLKEMLCAVIEVNAFKRRSAVEVTFRTEPATGRAQFQIFRE
jgi:hypothetical protein